MHHHKFPETFQGLCLEHLSSLFFGQKPDNKHKACDQGKDSGVKHNDPEPEKKVYRNECDYEQSCRNTPYSWIQDTFKQLHVAENETCKQRRHS